MFKKIKRAEEIFKILSEQGFYWWLLELGLHRRLGIIHYLKYKNKKQEITPQKLRETLEKLGPLFIKIGQILSLRPDILPPEYCKELEKLQDKCEEVNYNEIEPIIKKNIDITKFKKIEKKPLSTASISQIHKAILKNNKQVIIKVIKPNTYKIIEQDLMILESLAQIMNKTKYKTLHPLNIIKDLKSWLLKEINLENETINLIIFKELFKKDRYIYIPTIYSELSNSKVLVMEYIKGELLKNYKKKDLKKYLKIAIEFYIKSILNKGIFHADPHPSNIIITKNKIVPIDFGIVGKFDEKKQIYVYEILDNFLKKDIDGLINNLEKYFNTEFKNREVIKGHILLLLNDINSQKDIKDIKITYKLEKIFYLIGNKENINVDTNLVLLAKTLAMIEGVALEFYPNYNVVKELLPLLKKYKKQKITNTKDILETTYKYKELFETLPGNISSIVNRINKKEFKINVDDLEINKLTAELYKSTNKLLYALIVSSSFLAASILMHLNIKTVLFGMNIYSFIFFIIGFIFFILMLDEIILERKIYR